MGDRQERCELCAHYREWAATPGGQADSAWCQKDGNDTEPDSWCQAFAAREYSKQ